MFERVDGHRRVLHSAAVRFCAVVASFAFCLPVGAQPDLVWEPRESIVETAVTSDGAIWLQTQTPTGRGNQRYALIRVSSDLGSYSARELPDSFLRGIAPFRDGVLTPSFERSSEQLLLHWIGPEPDAAIERWYAWSDGHADTFGRLVAPAIDGSAVYVVSRDFGGELSKLAADGDEQWRRLLGDRQTRMIVATLDGVVALSSPYSVNQPPGYRLTAFSSDGDEVSRIDTAFGGERAASGDIRFVPPSTVALLQPPRFVLFDTVDQAVRALSIPLAANRARPVPEALLYVGSAMGLPFLALIGDDGEFRWQERPNLDDGPLAGRFLVDIQPFAPDRLIVVTGRRSADERTAVEFIETSLERPALEARYGRCVESNVLSLLEREQVIPREFGIGVRLRRNFVIPAAPTDADGCALPTESDYFGFLSELATELERRDFERPEQVVVQIDVDVLEQPFRMNDYHVNWNVRDAPATSVRYFANPSSARDLAGHLTDTVKPHFERMVAAVNEFRELTGCRLTVEKPADEQLPPERFYAETEAAVDHVLAEARRIAAELNSAESASRYCALLVNARGFGRYRELNPLSQAEETLREAAVAANDG